jgi:Lipocalin-like domain
MKKIILPLLILIAAQAVVAQYPVGKWKMVSHISVYEGQKFDSHAALLTQRPCAAKIFYEITANNTYRLNAANSGCDEKYKNIQEKLYSKTMWRVQNGKITISTQKDFSVGQTYTITISGNKMTWVGTEGQGTIVYQKL